MHLIAGPSYVFATRIQDAPLVDDLALCWLAAHALSLHLRLAFAGVTTGYQGEAPG